MKIRNSKYDNIKGILIICVILGHLLELNLDYGIHKVLYVMIYSFHMPVFVYVSGYFAKADMTRICKKLLYPYLIFQVLYIFFAKVVLGQQQNMQFLTPYWLLWYLLAMIVWSLVLPFVKGNSSGIRALILITAIGVALLVGYQEKMGRMFSLSRIIVFFPFFLLGYYCKEEAQKKMLQERCNQLQEKYRVLLSGITFIMLAIVIIIGVYYGNAIDRNWLYEAVSYAKGGYGIGFRAMHLLIALVWGIILYLWIPNRRIPLLTYLGRNTMQIFLLHGFLVKWFGKLRIMESVRYPTVVTMLVTIALVASLSVFSMENFHKFCNHFKTVNIKNEEKDS